MAENNMPEVYGYIHDGRGYPLTFERGAIPLHTAIACSTIPVCTIAQADAYASKCVSDFKADAERYRAFFDAGLPITFLGVDYRTKAELDAAIDDFLRERLEVKDGI